MTEEALIPEDRHYSKDHEWVRIEGDTAVIGITDHAQHVIGDITFVDIPPLEKQVKQFDEVAAIESAKAAFEIFASLSGTVAEVNTSLEDAPEKVNTDPYGEGWICKLKDIDQAGLDNLLTTEQYREFVEQDAE